jgi:hypothetical protein
VVVSTPSRPSPQSGRRRSSRTRADRRAVALCFAAADLTPSSRALVAIGPEFIVCVGTPQLSSLAASPQSLSPSLFDSQLAGDAVACRLRSGLPIRHG